jgi:hypothetical protein
MRYLFPDAAAAIERMAAANRKVRASDVFRSAEGSLAAKATKPTAAKPPSFSAHNFGLAMDIDQEALRVRWGKISKKALDDLMDSYGWVCHRTDHAIESEGWHYNFLDLPGSVLGAKYRALINQSSADAVEQRIQDLYGSAFILTISEAQSALRDMKFYGGALDGVIGPLTSEAIKAFQRAWALPPSGALTEATQRTLAYVGAGTEIVP